MSDKTEKSKTESHDGAKVMGALLLGALIGAGIAYFLSSDEGKEMKKKVTDGVKDFVDNMKEKAHSYMDGENGEDEERVTENA
jgi:hypothetical protein